MKKFYGNNPIDIAVFISGTGSNLKNLILFSLKKKKEFRIKLVISDNSKSKGLIYAKKYNLKKKIVNFKNNLRSEKKTLLLLKKNEIKLICLAGFMKILSKRFIKYFNGKILNIHPSLLPKYKGLNTHYRAIKNKEKYAGCTVHYVNSKLDSGKIIMQKRIKILKNETPKSLKRRVLIEEHKLYPKALIKVLSNL